MVDFLDAFMQATPTNYAFKQSPITGAASSFISALGPEQIGLSPMSGAAQFRQDYPTAGLVTSTLGMAVPFVASYFIPPAMLTKVPLAGKALSWALNPEVRAAMPVRAAITEGMAKITPWEASRFAGSIGAESLGDTEGAIKSTAFSILGDYVLGGAGDAAFTLLRGGLPVVKAPVSGREALTKIMPQLDTNQMPQYLLRETADTVHPEISSIRQEFINEIYAEGMQGRVAKAWPDVDYVGQAHKLNALFSGVKGIKAKGMLEYDNNEIANLLTGIPDVRPDNFASLVQFPRVYDGKALVYLKDTRGKILTNSAGEKLINPVKSAEETEKKVGEIRKFFSDQFDSKGYDNTWLTRDPDTGLSIVGKQVTPTNFMVFKTDNPALFVPPNSQFNAANIGTGKFAESWQAFIKAGRAQLSTAKEFDPLANAILSGEALGVRRGQWAEAVAKKLDATAPEAASNWRNAVENVRGFTDRWFAPSQFQFTGSKLAARLFRLGQLSMESGQGKAIALLYGKPNIVGKDVSAFDAVVLNKNVKRAGGVGDTIKNFTPSELDQFMKISTGEALSANERAVENTSIKEILSNPEISENVKSVVSKLAEWNAEYVHDLRNLRQLNGEEFNPLADHFGLSHIWRGDHRVPVMDAKGQVVAYGAGHQRAHAVSEAQAIARQVDGVTARPDLAFVREQHGAQSDASLRATLDTNHTAYKAAMGLRREAIDEATRRGFEKNRTGVRGFILDPIRREFTDAPFTAKELADIVESSVITRERLRSELTYLTSPKVQRMMSQLMDDNPEVGKQLQERIGDLVGKTRPIPQFIEGPINQVLSPYLGTGGATKIVNVLNRTMYNLSFGFGNIAFPVVNALQFMQTTLPKIAFLKGAVPEHLSRYYTSMPLFDKNKVASGALAQIDMFKLMRQSFREMAGHGDEMTMEHIRRAMNESVVNPRFAEEAVGENSKLGSRLFKSFDPGSFAESLLAANEYLPTVSEKFGRLHSFMLNRIIARDFLRGNPEAIYQFAKEATERDMFMYGAADRSAIFAGAIGGAFGLYKNWMMHYIYNLGAYASVGVREGQWAPFLWANAGTAALAGVGGTAIWGMAEGANSLFSSKPLMQNMQALSGYVTQTDNPVLNEIASPVVDSIFYGIPAFFGMTVQSSASVPGSDIQRDLGQLYSLALAARAQAFGKAVGATVDQWRISSEHPLQSARVRDLWVQALAPKTMSRAWNLLANQAEPGLRSLSTGNSLLHAISPFDVVTSVLGATPISIQKHYEMSGILWSNQEAMRTQVSAMGTVFADAMQRNDTDTIGQIVSEAGQLGIMDSVIKSAQTRLYKQNVDVIDRQFDDYVAYQVRKDFGQ